MNHGSNNHGTLEVIEREGRYKSTGSGEITVTLTAFTNNIAGVDMMRLNLNILTLV